jgi:transcriptional regulator GlxA family with amidase domain
VDTLRLAADEGDRSRPIHCRWDVLSHDLDTIRSSAGIQVKPTRTFGDPGEFDYIATVGGLLHGQSCSRQQADFLRRAAAQGVPLVGLCTGSFVLARLGLMEGVRCCVSWFHHDAFTEEFPDVPCTSEALYAVEDDRLTCAGGTSVVHLASHIIESFAGKARAEKALRILIENDIQPDTALQPAPLYSERTKDTRVRRAMLLIERNIENPMSCEFIARQSHLSVRQLERLFKTALGLSPTAYAERLRMARAHDLLHNSHEPLYQIAIRCGYRNHSHFSMRFKMAYGVSPSSMRVGVP